MGLFLLLAPSLSRPVWSGCLLAPSNSELLLGASWGRICTADRIQKIVFSSLPLTYYSHMCLRIASQLIIFHSLSFGLLSPFLELGWSWNAAHCEKKVKKVWLAGLISLFGPCGSRGIAGSFIIVRLVRYHLGVCSS